MALVELRNIHKSYRDGENRTNEVLRGLCMDVERGKFVAVRGSSGSGKTTLLSILGTLLLPDGGSYCLDGVEMLTPNTDHSSVRSKRIGFVFQDHRLMPQYTVLENILLPTLAHASKASGSDIAYAHELMYITHITHLAQQYPSEISGGESSRVAVCRSLIMKPLLLLADEPTGQLDRDNARHTAQLLSQVNRHRGTTIVMVTHSDEISSFAHRVLTLEDGILS